MANSSRRVPPSATSQYYAVPQSPRRRSSANHAQYSTGPSRNPSSNGHYSHQGQTDITADVAAGAIGAGYGPYAVSWLVITDCPEASSRFMQHNPGANTQGMYTTSRFSQSELSSATGEKLLPPNTSSTVTPYSWDAKDPDLDDPLHNPDPVRDAALDRSFTLFSARGWLNVSALVLVVAGLLTLFAGYPIISFYRRHELQTLGDNFGGSNSTGQIPSLNNLPSLLDIDTPTAAHTKTGSDGKTYNLVFSDEFTQDGRTFWPGDDPYWEAVDLHYW